MDEEAVKVDREELFEINEMQKELREAKKALRQKLRKDLDGE